MRIFLIWIPPCCDFPLLPPVALWGQWRTGNFCPCRQLSYRAPAAQRIGPADGQSRHPCRERVMKHRLLAEH